MEDAKKKEAGKKALHFLPADQEMMTWQKYVFWHPKARATSYCLLLDTF